MPLHPLQARHFSARLKHVQLLSQVDYWLWESCPCPLKYPWRPQKNELLYQPSLFLTRHLSATCYSTSSKSGTSATLKHVQLLNQVDCELLECFSCPLKYSWRAQKKELLYQPSLFVTRHLSATCYSSTSQSGTSSCTKTCTGSHPS